MSLYRAAAVRTWARYAHATTATPTGAAHQAHAAKGTNAAPHIAACTARYSEARVAMTSFLAASGSTSHKRGQEMIGSSP